MMGLYNDYEEQAPLENAAPAPWYQAPMAIGGGAAISPVTYLIGIIGVIVLMKLLGESTKTDVQPAHIKIGGYNVIVIALIAITGSVGLKLVFNKFPVPGLTELVNAA
jgi:hypothetical protein